MHHLVEPRDGIFVKGYRFLSFTKKYGKNIGKNKGKNLNGKYCQKLHDHAKKSTTDTIQLLHKSNLKNSRSNGRFNR